MKKSYNGTYFCFQDANIVVANGNDGATRQWDRRQPRRPVRTIKASRGGAQLSALHDMRGASAGLDLSNDGKLLLTGSALGGNVVLL